MRNQLILKRSKQVQHDLNELEKDGYRLEAAMTIVSERYFISVPTVWKDYKRPIPNVNNTHPANTPPTR